MSNAKREVLCRKYGTEAVIQRRGTNVVFVYCPHPNCEIGQSVNLDDPVIDLSVLLREVLKAKADLLSIEKGNPLRVAPTGDPPLDLDKHFRVH